MALKHKGLAFESQAVCMSDKAAIAFSGGKTVPVIKDGETVVRDSWKIAEHLEEKYLEGNALFGNEVARGMTQTFNTWTYRVLIGAMMPVIVADLHQRIDPRGEAFFRSRFERFLGEPIADTRPPPP